MQDIITTLISLFLVEPLQDRVAQWFVDAGVPQQVAARVASCFAEASPGILDRASNDPAWAAYQAVGYWTGVSSTDAILGELAPQCVAPVDQAPSDGQQAGLSRRLA